MPIEAQQHEVGEANGAGDHDRRIGPAHFLVGDGKRRLRQPAAPFDRRAVRRLQPRPLPRHLTSSVR